MKIIVGLIKGRIGYDNNKQAREAHTILCRFGLTDWIVVDTEIMSYKVWKNTIFKKDFKIIENECYESTGVK